MAAIAESIHKSARLPTFPSSNPSLPLSRPDSDSEGGVLRRRLSSLSLKLQPISASTTSWALRSSKSVSSAGAQAGTSIRTWWDSAWAWVLSRKPLFATDLEMNEEETKMLGSKSKGSLRHVFYKVRAELGRLVGSDHPGLPQTCRYDPISYSNNYGGRKTHRSY